MRRFGCIIIALMVIMLSGACQRRPFAEHRTKVALNLVVKTNIINHVQTELPRDMRVDLYDPQTGGLMYTDYVGPHGGYIHPTPGVYDMVVYSIGSESTIIRNDHNYYELEAYTNEVSSFIKSQMAQFLANRAAAAMERAAKEKSDIGNTKGPKNETDEPIVNQPEHMFVGWYHNLNVPVIYEDDDVREIYVEVDAHTIVETWQVEVETIEGVQWINSVASLISGQRGSMHIGTNEASERVVSVYFDLSVADREDGGKCLKGKFNTFGKHPDQNNVSLDLNIKDLIGGDNTFHFDVTDQFVDNERRYILIQEKITIEEPKVEGGGFQPVVGEWDEVNTDIIL